MNRIRLGVNIDHVATLRQARGTPYPEVLAAARAALAAGADSITVHLREDRRHIQDADVAALLGIDGLVLNLELAATAEMLAFAERWRPPHACLVPERRAELTTEGGLDVAADFDAASTACRRLAGAGVVPALFIDPDSEQIAAAAGAGAQAVELHTGAYADAAAADRELERLRRAAAEAANAGLEVHAGHGLHLDNVGAVAAIPEIVELNIGHALVARAVFVGLETAVAEMAARMRRARSD